MNFIDRNIFKAKMPSFCYVVTQKSHFYYVDFFLFTLIIAYSPCLSVWYAFFIEKYRKNDENKVKNRGVILLSPFRMRFVIFFQTYCGKADTRTAYCVHSKLKMKEIILKLSCGNNSNQTRPYVTLSKRCFASNGSVLFIKLWHY